MRVKATNPGTLLAFGSALTYCVQNAYARLLFDNDMTVWGALVLRGFVGVLVVAGAAKFFKLNVLGHKRLLLTVIGLCGFLSTCCTLTAIASIPLYQAIVLLYLYPAISVPLNYAVNGLSMRTEDIKWLFAAFCGCLLLVWPDDAVGLTFELGHVIGICGAALYSLCYVLIARLGSDNCGLEPLCYYSIWALVGVGAFIVLTGHDPGLNGTGPLLSGMALGVIALAALLMGYAALRWVEPYKVGIIGMLEVFGGALCSWLFFQDPMGARALGGGLLILFVALRLRRA